MSPAGAPSLRISLEFSESVYHRLDGNQPRLWVTTELVDHDVVTIETRGQFDSGTVLNNFIRGEHFEWFDLTAQRIVDKTPFPGTCEPRVELYPRDVVEIHRSEPLKTGLLLEDMNPLADPVNLLENGHEYKVRLKRQEVWGIGRSISDLFRGRDGTGVPVSDLPNVPFIALASDDEIYIKVEA